MPTAPLGDDLWMPRWLRPLLARFTGKSQNITKTLIKPTRLENGPFDKMEWHDSVDVKLKGIDFKKSVFEGRSGGDLHRKTGRWSKIERAIDRQHDRYREQIIDADTGQVLHSCDEPLSSHRDRGSAKKPKTP